MATPGKPEQVGKQYSLKPIETALLTAKQQTFQADLSNLLSFIATERLAVNVTPATQFQLSEDLKEITVIENEAETPEGEIVTDVSEKGKK